MEDYIIIEDFLPKTYHNELKATITSREFNWHLVKNVSYGNDPVVDEFIANDPNIVETNAFSHMFYYNTIKESAYCDLVRPALYFVDEKTDLTITSIERMRAVYAPRDKLLEGKYNVPHLDMKKPHMTMIYYLNDSDGGTILFKDKYNKSKILSPEKKEIETVVDSKEGRCVIFDGHTYHTGIVPSFEDKILINFNFTVL